MLALAYKYIIRDLITVNNSQLENLLKITAQRLGTTPDALMNAAKSGDMSSILKNAKDGEKIQKVLSDPNAAQKLLSGKQAQNFINILGKENK